VAGFAGMHVCKGVSAMAERLVVKESKGRKKHNFHGRVNYAELTGLYIILAFLAAIFVVPFLWLISNSLKDPTEIFRSPIVWIPAVPKWDNFYRATHDIPFFLYLKNTMTIIVGSLVGSLISNSLVAYGFAKIKWKGRNSLFVILLITMMMPFQVIMIPQFLLFHKLGWIGTFLPLIVPTFFGNAFFVFLLRQFYIGIPNTISQSARVDGANEFVIFSRIILPLCKPALATIAIFTFMNSWNDFLGPLIFLSDDKKYTLAIGIQQIMSVNDPRWNILMAAGVLMTVPVLILFFLLQKYFIQGIAFTGIKG
jgi:multiple sugar transport system permease protein